MLSIRGWHITRFGRFHDETVEGLPDGMSVIHGPNEAGKSTLLAFLRGILFGFPKGNSAERKLTDGNGLVGRVWLSNESGIYIVARRFAPRQPLEIVLPNGDAGTNEDLKTILGSADDVLFRNVFAFSLQELQDLQSLTKEGVRDKMFSATLGGAARSPKAASAALDKRAKEFIKSGPGKPSLSDTADKIAQTDDALAKARGAEAEYRKLVGRQSTLTENRQNLRSAEHQLVFERTQLSALCELAPVERERLSLQKRLDALPQALPLPLDAAARLNDGLQNVRTASTNVQRTEQAIAEKLGRRSSIQVEEKLLACSVQIESIQREAILQHDRVEQRVQLRTALRSADHEIASRFSRIGEVWSADRLAAWDRSVARDREALEWQASFDRAKSRASAAEHASLTAMQRKNEAVAHLARARASLPTSEQPADEELKERWRQLRSIRGLRDRERDLAQDVKETERLLLDHRSTLGPEHHRPSWFVAALAALCATGGVWAGIEGRIELLIAGVVVGFAILFVAKVGAARRKAEDASREEDPLGLRLKTQLEQLELVRSQLSQATSQARISVAASPDEVTHAEEEIATARNVRTEYDQLFHRSEECERILSELKEHEAESVEEAAAAADLNASLQADWIAWCETHNVPSGLLPTQALSLFEQIDAACQDRERRDEIQRLLSNNEAAIANWISQVKVTATSLDEIERVQDVAEVQLAIQCEEWARRLANARTLAGEVAQIDAEAAALAARLESEALIATAFSNSLAELYESVGVRTETRYRECVQARDARLELEREVSALVRQISARLSELPDMQSASDTLLLNEESRWKERLVVVEGKLEDLRQEQSVCDQQIGVISRERETLEASSDVEKLAIERASLVLQLTELVRQWGEVQLAKVLVDRTREIYERDRQPAVIAHAATLFKRVTGGRYERIVQSEDGAGFEVIEANGERRREFTLSQGTQEQLYLCLRLGHAEEFARTRVALPFVLDDVLVNFDPTRAEAMACLLAEVAKRRQILLFTCHPETRDLMKRCCEAVKVIELQPLPVESHGVVLPVYPWPASIESAMAAVPPE